MRRPLVVLAVVSLTAVLAACGSGGPVQVTSSGGAASTVSGTVSSTNADAAPSTAGSPTATATTPAASTAAVTRTPSTSPFPFATPEAAMRYLAAAYNRHDARALRSVTTPIARQALLDMRAEAVGLRLGHCEHQPAGDYLCWFVHDYPRALGKPATAHGEAIFTAAPATKQGWYMTVLLSCG
jgi:hypothetical protein